MKQKVVDAVNMKNIETVRLSLSNELLLDPRGVSFEEMLKYAELNLVELYEDDNNKNFSESKSDWNNDYLLDLKNELDSNFSRKKLNLYKIMAMVVLRAKADDLNRKDREVAIRPTYEESISTKTQQNNANICKGIIIGGVIIVITGLCLSKAIIVIIGVAGIVAGTIMLNKK